jgi:sugar phosphate isomerase/epimerase
MVVLVMKRRKFLRNSVLGAGTFAITPLFTCSAMKKELKISLAQWSLHRSFENGELDPVDFASIARKKYNIDAVEYVNGFYPGKAEDEAFWKLMKTRSDDAGVKNLIMMVDEEGDLGAAGEKERLAAVENHHKWIRAAAILGIPTVRVNAFGDADLEIYKPAIMDSMARLADYAAPMQINIVIENHGLFSSDAALMAGIMQEVNRPNFGSLPDFGNWCLTAKWGTTQDDDCIEAYDRYQGVAELLPYAKAVSAKSYNFNEQGEDTKIDYYRMMKIVKNSSYSGYIGIEYEGTEKSEHEGIIMTRALLERVWEELK